MKAVEGPGLPFFLFFSFFFRKTSFCARMARMDSYKSGIGTGTVSSHVHNPVSRIETGRLESQSILLKQKKRNKKKKEKKEERRDLHSRILWLAMWEESGKSSWGGRTRDVLCPSRRDRAVIVTPRNMMTVENGGRSRVILVAVVYLSLFLDNVLLTVVGKSFKISLWSK